MPRRQIHRQRYADQKRYRIFLAQLQAGSQGQRAARQGRQFRRSLQIPTGVFAYALLGFIRIERGKQRGVVTTEPLWGCWPQGRKEGSARSGNLRLLEHILFLLRAMRVTTGTRLARRPEPGLIARMKVVKRR